MNDWGIPDWQDASKYGPVDKWNWFKWRWEFSRRRDDLRAAFDERSAESYQRSVDFDRRRNIPPGHILRSDQAGFTAHSYTTDAFGYYSIPNPRISDQPAHIISGVVTRPESIKIFHHWRAEEIGPEGASETVVVDSNSEVAIVFDLSRPISEQIKSARTTLMDKQKLKFGKSLQKRSHQSKWLSYLRILDGREAGASWSQLATILPHTAASDQTARDVYDQAHALRFNF